MMKKKVKVDGIEFEVWGKPTKKEMKKINEFFKQYEPVKKKNKDC